MSNINRLVFCTVFLLVSSNIFAESEGGALFRQNMPDEAIPLLESSIENGTAEPDDYNFLGLAYFQKGEWEKSEQTFEKGLAASGTNKRVLAYNAGNTCFVAGDYEKAEDYYSLAIIADSNYKEAILNRANARFRQDNLASALEDYELFYKIAPHDKNADLVYEMISILKNEITSREQNARMEAELERRRQGGAKNGEATYEISDETATSESDSDDATPEPSGGKGSTPATKSVPEKIDASWLLPPDEYDDD